MLRNYEERKSSSAFSLFTFQLVKTFAKASLAARDVTAVSSNNPKRQRKEFEVCIFELFSECMAFFALGRVEMAIKEHSSRGKRSFKLFAAAPSFVVSAKSFAEQIWELPSELSPGRNR